MFVNLVKCIKFDVQNIKSLRASFKFINPTQKNYMRKQLFLILHPHKYRQTNPVPIKFIYLPKNK